MRLAALAIVGLFALGGCRPVVGLRAAGALQARVAPSCVADAISGAPGIARIEVRERRRDGRGVVEIRYFGEDDHPGRLFLVTEAAGQHVVLSSTWLVGWSPRGGEGPIIERFREIEARVSSQCGGALMTTRAECDGSACWALNP